MLPLNVSRLNVAVFYDDLFHQQFPSTAKTRISAMMALIDEVYSESSFKTKLDVNTKVIKHAKGKNWGIKIWDADTGAGRTKRY